MCAEEEGKLPIYTVNVNDIKAVLEVEYDVNFDELDEDAKIDIIKAVGKSLAEMDWYEVVSLALWVACGYR